MPLKSLILLRHAESIEDIDPVAHRKDDAELGITKNGESQIFGVVNDLLKIIDQRTEVKVFVSPSRRAQETFTFLQKLTPNIRYIVETDPRIRNLNWGKITQKNRKIIEQERYKAGVLNYCFPGGDKTPEYVSNLKDVLDSSALFFSDESHPEITLFITHGFALRVLAKLLLQLSDEDFRWLANPRNCHLSCFDYNETLNIFTIRNPLPTVPIDRRSKY